MIRSRAGPGARTRCASTALERFQAARLRQLMAGDEVWTSDELNCAALWAPPGRWHMSLRETAMLVPCFLRPRLFARMPLVALGWEKLERGHPRKPPHFYLAVLGTEPAAQGRGLGSAVLGGVLEQCDRDGDRRVSRVLQGAQHRLLRAPRVPRDRGDPAAARPARCGRCGASRARRASWSRRG